MVNSIQLQAYPSKRDLDSSFRNPSKKTSPSSDFDLQYGMAAAGSVSPTPQNLVSTQMAENQKFAGPLEQSEGQSLGKTSDPGVNLANLGRVSLLQKNGVSPLDFEKNELKNLQSQKSLQIRGESLKSMGSGESRDLSVDSQSGSDEMKALTDLLGLADESGLEEKEYLLDPRYSSNTIPNASNELRPSSHITQATQAIQELSQRQLGSVAAHQNQAWNGKLMGSDYLSMLGALQPTAGQERRSLALPAKESQNSQALQDLNDSQSDFEKSLEFSIQGKQGKADHPRTISSEGSSERSSEIQSALQSKMSQDRSEAYGFSHVFNPLSEKVSILNEKSKDKDKDNDDSLGQSLSGTGLQGSGTGLRESPSIKDVTAFVVPGAMSRGRINTDGLMSMSSQIQSLSIKGGGEMRVRLKPENLGELNLRVIANGNHVGLQIQASDERAKKIIEESLGYLKESLSAQKLSLGQVDLTVVGSQQSQAPFKVGDAQGFGQESLPQNTNPNYSQGQSNQSYSGSSRSSENVPSSVNSMRGHSGVLGAQPLRTHWSGDKSRLDVMA